jgi:hypothetical protein
MAAAGWHNQLITHPADSEGGHGNRMVHLPINKPINQLVQQLINPSMSHSKQWASQLACNQ